MANKYGQTEISGYNKSRMNQKMTSGDMIFFLENEAKYRTFSGELTKRMPPEEEKKQFIERLSEMTGKSYDTSRKNVTNWLNGKNEPQRKNLFQLCFALNLGEEDADNLMSCTDEAGIHYRNPEELIYAFCLRTNKTWADAERLKGELLPLYERAKTEEKAKPPIPYTRSIERDFNQQVHTEENLKHFLITRAEILGDYHETAYREFARMLSYLQNPSQLDVGRTYYDYLKNEGKKRTPEEQREWEEYKKKAEKYSIQQVIENYMQMFVPDEGRRQRGRRNANVPRRDYTQLQRVIQKNWPTADVLDKMKNRSCDVSRKVMLLLFLLTEEFEMKTPDEEVNNDFFSLLEQDSPAELMEARLIQIDLFLDKYGMNRLDPGRPFDLLVLYALQAEYSQDEDISDRMAEVIGNLFQEEMR